jgi:hypothetical protein
MDRRELCHQDNSESFEILSTDIGKFRELQKTENFVDLIALFEKEAERQNFEIYLHSKSSKDENPKSAKFRCT